MRTSVPLAFAALLPAVVTALPQGFVIRDFGGPPQLEYPTAISAAANGDVYVSSDRNGSLGHVDAFGKIVRARDTDGDGKADEFIDFVPDVDSPRGGHFTGGTFYLIHPPYLSSYRDTNGDGVADETKQLVKGFGWGIEHPRGADHTTNGVRMGIDGWLYVSVGDFGMPAATGADGARLTLHGGGVVRVRPDGSEMEVFSSMTRNICDTAISPYLDLFSRDNTNDGKGWNTRFHHFSAMTNAGYPRLYQNFADETASPLADYGGGSGTGALYLHEPGFPKEFGDGVFTCDWTTGNIYQHPMTPFEATFIAKQKVFLQLPRAIDIDVDGFSRLYVADWRNGGFNYTKDKEVGRIQQLICPGETPAAYVEVTAAKDADLPPLLASRSAVQRLETQREILARGKKPEFARALHALAKNPTTPLYGRVAAIFTFKQLYGKDATAPLLEFGADPAVREFALRAVTDRLSELDGIPGGPYLEALKDKNPRVVLQAAIGLARLKGKAAGSTRALLAAAATFPRDESKLQSGAHFRVPHTLVKSLVAIQDVPALLKGVAIPAQRDTALRALQEIHGTPAAAGLIALADSTKDPTLLDALLPPLARLYFIEKPWDLNSWWSTRPDDRGPYFEPVTWDGTPKVKAAIERIFDKLPRDRQNSAIEILSKNRLPIGELRLGDLDPVVLALSSATPSPAYIPLLADAAKSPKRPWDQRIEACRAITKTPNPESTPLLVGVLAEWSTEPAAPPAALQAIGDFINDPSRGTEAEALLQIAAKGTDAASRIAWKTLLTVLNSPLAKDPQKKRIRAAIAKNPREIGFFHAITDLKLSGFDTQIEVGLRSDNRLLIDAAMAAKAAAPVAGTGRKVAELPPADVMRHAMSQKGDPATGQRLFTTQGCIACHAIDLKAEQKGPYLGAAGAKFTRDYLIESILDPNKVVAQGFRTAVFKMKDGSMKMGFVTAEEDGIVSLRDIAGQSSRLPRAEVETESELPTSMMPPGLGGSLSVEDFTSLIEYLTTLRSVGG